MINNDTLADPFKVFIRIRPILGKEIINYERNYQGRELKPILIPKDNQLFVKDPDLLDLNVIFF
jgi:hypothetical protein